MTPEQARLASLLRHVEHVRDDCEVVGRKLIDRGDVELGLRLIRLGREHDASKFAEPEWSGLGSESPGWHTHAWTSHVSTNAHHPEFWAMEGGVHAMPPEHVAEMVCDWHARSSEFGTCLRSWIESDAMPRYGFTKEDVVWRLIEDFLSLLLEPRFS